jgi:hypothetical protein
MLTETNQGSNSGQSITHDSDPRKLEFESVDYYDAPVEQFGTSVDLTNALVLGAKPAITGPTFADLSGAPAVVGPTMNDLAGGAGNAMRIYLQRAAKITDLTAGDYVCRMYATDGTNVFEQIFDLRMADLLALMAAQPEAANGGMIDITTLVSDWVTWTNSHYFINEFEYQSSVPFTGGGVTASSIIGKMFFGSSRNSVSALYDTTGGESGFIKLNPDQSLIQDDAYTPVVPQTGDRLFLDFQVNGTGVSGIYDFQTDIPLDAASIKAQLNDSQLSLQQGGQGIFYHGLLDAYCTSAYTFTGAIGMFTSPYSVSTLGVEPLAAASQLSFSLVGGPAGQFGQRPTQLQDNITDPTSTPPTYTNDYPQGYFASFTGDQSDLNGLNFTFDLSPKSQSSHVKVYGTDFANNKLFDVSIAYLQSIATSEQLASQSPTFEIPLEFAFDVYKVDFGYTGVTSAITTDGNSYVGVAFDAGSVNYFHHFSELPYTSLDNYNNYPGAQASKLILHFNLLPKTAPAVNNPILCTRPYELRNRNNPAFRFDFEYALSGTPYDTTLDVAMLVSQGEVGGKTLWTRCPSLCFGNTFPTGGVSDVIPLTFPAANAWTPANWQGNIIKMPDFATANGAANGTFSGPWNYVKFMLFNPGGAETTQDYSNWRLEIIANAREL